MTSARLVLRLLALGALTASCVLPGCAAPTDDDDDEDRASQESELVTPGAWALPADVRAAGQQQAVGYDDAPAWRGAGGCGGSILAGTRELGDHLKASFPGAVTSYGGYSCRQNTANKAKTSVHGTGRALDVFIPLERGAADNGKGDQVANWLVRNAANIGVQLVIWDRTIWQASRSGEKASAYGGPHPHHDHIHLELTNDGAARKTAFFNGAKPGTSVNKDELVDVKWNGLPGHKYSLDIRNADGAWVGPCLGVARLQATTSVTYQGVCEDGAPFPKAQVTAFRVYYSDNDAWTKFAEAPFDGKAPALTLQLPGETDAGAAPESGADSGAPEPAETTTPGSKRTSTDPLSEERSGGDDGADDDDDDAPEDESVPAENERKAAVAAGCSSVASPASDLPPTLALVLGLATLGLRRPRRSRGNPERS